MAKLNAKQRNGLDTASFALPGRRYPINDASHARNAMSRASANASPAEQATIKAKVKRRFPSIEVGGKPKKYADGGKVEQRQYVPEFYPNNSASVGQQMRDEGSRLSSVVSKGMEMVGRMMNTDKGKMMKAADAAMSGPKSEKQDTTKRRSQIDDAEEKAVKGYADGGKVEDFKEPIGRIEVKAKRMTPEEAKAYDDSQKPPPVQRTINGAPIRNPSPAKPVPPQGGVRG